MPRKAAFVKAPSESSFVILISSFSMAPFDTRRLDP
jgi:hypothetical protein